MPETGNDIFKISEIHCEAGHIKVELGINKASAIFEGHFPGQPVVPGACMVQLVKDILEDVLSSQVRLKKAANIKFVSMITPDISDTLSLTINYRSIEEGSLSTNAQIATGKIVCFKMQALFENV